MPASGKSPKKSTTKTKAKPAVEKKTTKSAAAHKTKTAAAKKAPAKAKKPAPAGGMAPMIDTSFAAESAARMLAARAKMGNAPSASTEAPRESGMFKQMKDNLNKPAGGGINTAMGNTFGPNKTNLPNPDKGHVV